jgi:non-specific serine/threonine protein kinase
VTDLAVERRTTNLPTALTRFVGRHRELSQVRLALERSRLVSLCGVGGVGKTRLALEIGAGLQDVYSDGVWIAELSALRKPELLARTVAEALRLPDRASGDPLDVLAEHLADRHLLLILDTCEHLIDSCAMLAEVLIRSAPRLTILATSREPLDVIGEYTLMISPLAVPDPAAAGLAGCDSVELFLDRAQAAVPEFSATPDNEVLLARLCRRLDGIPLALELAAVRLRAMSLEQIIERLDDRFRLLGTTRSSKHRHQTLRAAVEWSYDLCTPPEQLLWARLSVFPGTFDLEACESVCGGDDLPGECAYELLARLVERSVVIYDHDGARYRMLDTIREYGAERLGETEWREQGNRRHRDFYLALADRVAAEQMSAEQLRWLNRLHQETANLRVALEWSLSTAGEQSAGVRMAVALRQYWYSAGQFTEGRNWYRQALSSGAVGEADLGWATFGAGLFAVLQGDLEAAEPLLSEAEALGARLGDRDLQAHAVQNLGLRVFYTGDLAGGMARYVEAKEIYAEIGYSDPAALYNYVHLASVCTLNREIGSALAWCTEALNVCDTLGEQWARSYVLWIRGGAHWMGGEIDQAVADLRQSLRVKEPFGDLMGIAMCVDVLMLCAVTQREFERACVLAGASATMWQTLRAPVRRGPDYSRLLTTAEETAVQALGEEQVAASKIRGASLPFAAAIALALGERADAEDMPCPLTPRELEVADMIVAGLTNREIAGRLVVSKRTVDSHVEHIMAKLAFNSRTQIAAWARRRTV